MSTHPTTTSTSEPFFELLNRCLHALPVHPPEEVDSIRQNDRLWEANLGSAERLPNAVGFTDRVRVEEGYSHAPRMSKGEEGLMEVRKTGHYGTSVPATADDKYANWPCQQLRLAQCASLLFLLRCSGTHSTVPLDQRGSGKDLLPGEALPEVCRTACVWSVALRQKCTGHLTPVTTRVAVAELVDDNPGIIMLKRSLRTRHGTAVASASREAVRQHEGCRAYHNPPPEIQVCALAEGSAPASINHALEVLRAAYRRGASNTPRKVIAVPRFEMMDVKNTREGFVETPEYVATVAQCRRVGAWMLGIYEIGHTFGWRKEEVIALQVKQLNTLNSSVRIAPDTTKDRAGRLAYMPESLYLALEPLVRGKKPNDYVFTRPNGERVMDFDKTWWEVCVAVAPDRNRMFCRACKTPTTHPSKCVNPDCGSANIGYRGRLYHDLRRTAITNMVNSGIPEKVAMMISGHRTAAVFKRYHIVVESALEDAAEFYEQRMQKQIAKMLAAEGEIENRSKTGLTAKKARQPKRR